MGSGLVGGVAAVEHAQQGGPRELIDDDAPELGDGDLTGHSLGDPLVLMLGERAMVRYGQSSEDDVENRDE